jgi:3-methylcrotonyl-CoA carboxylase alpha subunit
LHVWLADDAVCIGPADQQPYQNIKNLIQVAKQANVDAIHPGKSEAQFYPFNLPSRSPAKTKILGYGYLSENAEFARAVADAGLVFVGPTPESISKLGNKRDAKELLSKNSSVPLIPGYGGHDQDPAHMEAEADKIGYPVLIKASAGGGGKGMRVVNEKAE